MTYLDILQFPSNDTFGINILKIKKSAICKEIYLFNKTQVK